MPSMRSFVHAFAGLALIHGVEATPPRECPPLGPALPAPRNPSAHPGVQSAVQALLAGFKAQAGGFNHSAVSVGVSSIHEDDLPPLLDFHHTPSDPGAKRGAKEVTARTVYRVGSVTKVFAVLAALQLAEKGALRMDDSVGKWVPGLGGDDWTDDDALDLVGWEDVTVDSVATHLSGIGADLFLDLAAFPANWEGMGFPKIPDDAKKPECSGLGNTRPCTAEDLVNAFKDRRPPIYAPYTSPVYSNVGIALVGLVVEAAAGKSFEDVIRPAIYEPAGMKLTSLAVPGESEDLIIPTNGTSHLADIGVMGPAGSMNSNTEDLLAFMTAILKTKLLSPTGTRRWFRPASFTSGWSSTVGAPFEMYRIDNVTVDGRVIDVFTKGGDIIDYHATIAMIPEFGISISILTAGPETPMMFPQLLLSGILEALIPALDQAARDEAKQRFVGEYVNEENNSRLVVSADQGPGLLLTNWVMRGYEVFPNLDKYSPLEPNKSDAKPRFSSARLYPAGLETKNRAAWRAALPMLTDDEAELVNSKAAWKDAHCLQWLGTDRRRYNYVSLDHFEFVFGENGGEATGIRARAFDVQLKRASRKNLAAVPERDILADGQQAPLEMETKDL